MASDAIPESSAAITRFAELIFPEQSNHYGTLIGGRALHLMDLAAFVAASRHVRQSVVTAKAEQIDFHAPAQAGELAEVSAWVVSQGQRSIRVRVELHAEDLLSGSRRLCCSGYFVCVIKSTA